MTASTPLDHFSASQIRTALDELDPAHADLLSDFIGRIGGLENAALAVECDVLRAMPGNGFEAK